MRVLFDVVHPADVHLFRQTMIALSNAGHEVFVASRDKDITLPLLDALGMQHHALTRHGGNPVGLFAELLRRDIGLLGLAARLRPDVFVANNSPCAAHAAWAARRPSVVFEDTEIHRMNHRLYYSFVTEVHSPTGYRFSLGAKHTFYGGCHALAYLHPSYFQSDDAVMRSAGLDPDEPIVFARLVERSALHDVGLRGMPRAQLMSMLRTLARLGRLVISSEGPLPPELRQYRLDVPMTDVHHVIARARLVVGESATMCSEAAVLGTPAILIDEAGRGYTDHLESAYGLCQTFRPTDLEGILAAADAVLCQDVGTWRTRRARLLRESVDVAAYQQSVILRLGHERRPETRAQGA